MSAELYSILANAPSKELVEQVFIQAYTHGRVAPGTQQVFPAPILKKLAEALKATPAQVQELMITLAHLVEEVLFENLPAAEIVQLLPVDLSKNLKSLIAAIVTKNIPKWRETATSTQISLPRLVSTDWRVDVKTASESMSRFNQAGLIVEMQVQSTPTRSDAMPGQRHIAFELSKETLETMLDGLGKIRDQLDSITTSQ